MFNNSSRESFHWCSYLSLFSICKLIRLLWIVACQSFKLMFIPFSFFIQCFFLFSCHDFTFKFWLIIRRTMLFKFLLSFDICKPDMSFSSPLICLISVAWEDEPGKQVRSAISIKNTSKSHVAFKVWKICSSIDFFVFFYWCGCLICLIRGLVMLTSYC